MPKRTAYLQQKWRVSQVADRINDFEKQKRKELINALEFIGQKFIKEARENDSYRDRTGNLRSSIGYVIYDSGQQVSIKAEVAKKDTAGRGVRSVKQTASKGVSNRGLQLIVVAGMEYASAVESRGYDVLTTFAPSENEALRILKRLTNAD